MAIEINENVLLTIAGVIFVPIFVFLIKMIMEVANIRTQLDSFQEHLAATKDFVRHFTNIDYEIKWIKATLADIDSDLKYLFNTVHHNKDEEEKENRFGSRRRYKGGGGAGSRGGNTADQQEDNTTTTGTEN